MNHHSSHLIFVLVWSLTVGTSAAQIPEPSEEADGLVHVMLTLENQAISLYYEPALSDDNPVLTGTSGTRARIGTFEAHRALRIGSLAFDPDVPLPEPPAEGDAPPETPTHELWLVHETEGWELEAHHSQTGDVNIVALSHRENGASDGPFSASLHATGTEEGRLSLRWGPHSWQADFRFDEVPPAPSRPRVSGRNAAPRTSESDTSGFSRGVTLAERNETALALPDGRQITMLFWKSVDVEDEDYGRLGDTEEGRVVPFVRAAPLRIKSDVGLIFDGTELPTGNLAPGYAGAYGIWLRQGGSGWQFVFNNEPDSWGTQHDTEFDVVAVDVDYVRTDRSFRPLGVTLVPTAADTGRIVVHWGPHEWSADFSVTR